MLVEGFLGSTTEESEIIFTKGGVRNMCMKNKNGYFYFASKVLFAH
jgi:hypothetical protein